MLFEPYLRQQDAVIVDGGLATELEARGYDLRDSLWSARLLADEPETIVEVHMDYLRAGADVIISASYQATIAGFVARGLDRQRAAELLQLAVALARQARDAFWAEAANRNGRLRPLVAASVGPYGAFLADGSEYRGNYGLSEAELARFHRERWHLLAASGPDLMACETIPSAPEARALTRLFGETPALPAWLSFSCRDAKRLNDGTPLAPLVAELEAAPQLVALGVNCTAPRFIAPLVREMRGATDKPIIVYPNSGEQYHAPSGRWLGQSDAREFGRLGAAWRQAGAAMLGGCCRTGPQHIAELRRRLLAATGS